MPVANFIIVLFRPLDNCSNNLIVTVTDTLGRPSSQCVAINHSYCVSAVASKTFVA